MTTISAITGLHTRYDVKTKCKVVESIFNKTFSSKEEANEYIAAIAETLEVNPVTIKLWISKYELTYKEGLKLPNGVMSYSFLTIDDSQVSKVNSKLLKVRQKLNSIRSSYETTTLPNVTTAQIRGNRKSKEILDELIG